jgi:iodotyrosine deiodinase
VSGFRPYREYQRLPLAQMQSRAREFAEDLARRRTLRDFSTEPVPRGIIEDCLSAAASAPSGANRQPWHFVVVSDPDTKRAIREAAEVEEQTFYRERVTPEWLNDLAGLGTTADKPFLETAPYLIVIFAERFEVLPDGSHHKNYYVSESVGIATGMLISALHRAGLGTLTHTPSPMGFLRDVLHRPRSERPFLILVTGYPLADAQVPDIARKRLTDVVSWIEPEN